jgi:hypothetical protein
MVIVPPEDVSREVIVGRKRRVNLVRLARSQRLLLRLVLAAVCIYGATPMAAALLHFSPAARILVFVLAAIFLVLAIMSVVQASRLLVAAGGSTVVAYAVALPMIIPLVGLLIAALINERATKLLRANGAKVGFLGVTKEQMLKLTAGCCRGCGYSTAGLTGTVCPECGGPIS